MKSALAKTLVFIATLAALNAPAQAFDCAKATTEIEKLICATPELKQADDKMERAYQALRKKLDPIGRRQLLLSQRAWLKVRNDMIVVSTIATEYNQHTIFLEQTPSGMVPFYLQKNAKPFKLGGSKIGYFFANPKAGFQKTFNNQIRKALDDFTLGEKTDDTSGYYDVHFGFANVTRFDENLISATVAIEGAMGGAHPFHYATHVNLNVKTGKLIDIAALFTKSSLRKLMLKCAQELAEFQSIFESNSPKEALKIFNERYPSEIKKHLNDARRWQFDKTKTTISFNEYSIAPYVAGEQTCSFENAFLAPLSKRPSIFK